MVLHPERRHRDPHTGRRHATISITLGAFGTVDRNFITEENSCFQTDVCDAKLASAFPATEGDVEIPLVGFGANTDGIDLQPWHIARGDLDPFEEGG